MTMTMDMEDITDGLLNGYDWQQDGSCLGLEYDLPPGLNPFFRENRGASYKEARKWCHDCPVVIDCLVSGLHDHTGFRGCMTRSGRSRVRSLIRRGFGLVDAVESIWAPERESGRLTPPIEIWNEWT